MTIPQPLKWWHHSVVYQIYPRSFQDSNGDGVGDLRGITSRLDYLHLLGIDVLWLSPIYRSPQDDNGYDIADYQDIDPMFGSLQDFDELLAAAKERNIKIVMDLVVNHTSDEHAWFQESRQGPENPKADWYIWRPAKADGSPPNNWGSFFSGSAWQWDEQRGEYFLHLFSKKQPDLNWENAEVRKAVYQMMNWWLDRGVAGFRMDVIDLISKQPGLPDGNAFEQSANGPRLHEWLREMHNEVFAGREQFLTVGECPGLTPDLARIVTNPAEQMLDMAFHFQHVGIDQGNGKWDRQPFEVSKLRNVFDLWQRELSDVGWNSLYWNNHDQPRVVSRFGDDRRYRVESAKALATLLHMQRGTPYIYQGEELGMTNYPFNDITEFQDLETLNHFAQVHEEGGDVQAALAGYRFFGRDNARTPMQWTQSEQAGFTTGKPWLAVNPNAAEINAEAQLLDANSVFSHYRHLIELRRSDDVVALGDYHLLLSDSEHVYAIGRTLGDEALLCLVNLSGEQQSVELPADWAPAQALARVISANYLDSPPLASSLSLRPWEAIVYRW